MSRNYLDFNAINKLALSNLHQLLSKHLPGGKRVGKEYVALNPTRADQTMGSFKINLSSGLWADFATNDRGKDPVSLIAYIYKTNYYNGAKQLHDELFNK